MRMNLKVPFAEKDQVKKLGARWDAARKIWYVEAKDNLAAFAKWSPTVHEGTAGDELGVKKLALPRKLATEAATGKVIVGANYCEQPRVCDCLPWDDCEMCKSS